jgi:hypothetical protein
MRGCRTAMKRGYSWAAEVARRNWKGRGASWQAAQVTHRTICSHCRAKKTNKWPGRECFCSSIVGRGRVSRALGSVSAKREVDRQHTTQPAGSQNQYGSDLIHGERGVGLNLYRISLHQQPGAPVAGRGAVWSVRLGVMHSALQRLPRDAATVGQVEITLISYSYFKLSKCTFKFLILNIRL